MPVHESCLGDLRRTGWAYVRACMAGDPEGATALLHQYPPAEAVYALTYVALDLLQSMRENPHGEGCSCGTIDQTLRNLAEMEQ